MKTILKSLINSLLVIQSPLRRWAAETRRTIIIDCFGPLAIVGGHWMDDWGTIINTRSRWDNKVINLGCKLNKELFWNSRVLSHKHIWLSLCFLRNLQDKKGFWRILNGRYIMGHELIAFHLILISMSTIAFVTVGAIQNNSEGSTLLWLKQRLLPFR